MNLEELLNSNKIIFECVAGSYCYGTNTPQSDLDIRGCFLNSNKDVFSLFPAPIQVSDSKNDTTYYELRRFIQLALDNNPSILEYLFVPEDCIRIMKPEWKIFVDHRHLFISKKAKHTFVGYAYAQLKRAKGENKWIWQAKDGKFDKKPTLEDFCWFVAKNSEWKPQPIRDAFHDISLPKCKVSCFEHVAYSYRLYGPYENDPTAGVFSGGKPLPKSISKEEEVEKLLGMLIVNHDAYEKALKDWQNYQTWLKERNEARWTSQEKGEMDYDSKNLSHTVRLLLSGINILKNGEPLVRLSGNDLKLVKEVREGKYTYNEILDIASSYESELNRVYETTLIRSEPDRKEINELYCSVIGAS
jgi:hypothetical protein